MLSPIQNEIIEQAGNLIVRASAGAGKTHTMVEKIAYDIDAQHTHKVVAAITFTIKAANEIKERLSVDVTRHFIGTNNSFAIEEIIKPFMRDVYGSDFRVDMSTDYSIKADDFKEGISKIKHEHILCSYGKSHKKENFIFQLALDILKKSRACQLYLKSKYFKIYVDEYQDCDQDMHNLFMYICEVLKIDMFVVGDEKQSIYMWRGAYPQAFMSIWDRDDFSKKFMLDNYRSCQQIQNYSNLLCRETRSLYKPMEDLSPIIMVCAKGENWVPAVMSHLSEEGGCAILRYRNKDAEICANSLSNSGMEFVHVPHAPITDITTEAAWLYNAIAKYFIVPKYSAYDLRAEIPNDAVGNRRILSYIKKSLAELDNAWKTEDVDSFCKQTELLATYLGYEAKEEHCRKLYETIVNKRYYPAFNMENYTRVAITFHSSKGLEYDQVVLFVADFPLSNEEDIYNYYVSVTRAKSKLIMVCDNSTEARNFANNINRILQESNLKMQDLAVIDKQYWK